MKKKSIFKCFGTLLMAFICTAFVSINVNASETSVYVTGELEEGTYYTTIFNNGVEVRSNRYNDVVIYTDAEKKCGDYKFTKRIDLSGKGSIRQRCIASNVSGNVNKITVFALSSNEEEATLVFANMSGVIDTYTVNANTSDTVQKITFDVPSAGTYFIYSEENPVSIYAAYFGPITETEQAAMGKEFTDSTEFYNKVSQFQGKSEIPVVPIDLALFLVALLICLVTFRKHMGKGYMKKLFATKKKVEETTYKE